MASIGDLNGRVVITNASAGVLGKVKSDMDAIANASKRLSTNFAQYSQNLYKSAQHGLDRLNRSTAQHAAVAGAAGLSVRGIIDQTKEFNEAKFGYGFARITDYIKDGKLQMEAWRSEMNKTAREAQQSAKDFGTTPAIAMKAREDVEKLGFKGHESKSMFDAALGLHLSEPGSLTAGNAAKYMGAVYRAYQEQREELAKKLGKDANDPEFVASYMKGLAAKAAIAGAESALGPADIVEGMRQYAPQWAAMGIPYEMALAALAHGSNYGFRAPELGTAFKSMVTKVINPTAAGLGTLNLLGMDRQKYFSAGATDPGKAGNQLNSLLGGALYSGKRGKQNKLDLRQMLDTAYKDGVSTTPEFQEAMTQEVMRRMPKGWEGRAGDVQQAVANATVTANGNVKMFDMIRDLKEKGATTGQIATMFEGRHVARYTPLFKFYEQMIALADRIGKVDGSALDAVVEGRKTSEAGKTDQVKASWENLMINLEQSGGVLDRVKDAVIGFNNALAGMPTEALSALTAAVIAIGSVGGALLALKMAKPAAAAAKGAVNLTGIPAAVGAAAGAAGGVAGRALGRTGVLPRGSIVGPATGLGAGAGGAFMGATAGAVGSQAARRGSWQWVKVGGRFVMRFVPIAAGAASAYGAYQGYQETGTVGGAVRGALGIPSANAEGIAPPSIGQTRLMGQRPQQGPPDQQGGGGVDDQVRATVDRMRATLAEVDFTADGKRIIESLAQGIRNGSAAVDAAIGEVADRMRSQIGGAKLNTGPTMGATAQ